jgi:hypothetical protein
MTEGTYGEGIDMSRLITATLGAVAVLAMCGTSAAVATAAPEGPEYGRCVKTTGGGAGYSDKGCTNEVASGAAYEWVSGAGAKAHFTQSAGSATLETREGQQMTCAGMLESGQYTGASSQSLSITFTGCELGSAHCQSGANAGEIVSEPLEGLLGNIKAESDPFNGQAGIELQPASGETLLSFECAGASVVVTGSDIHEVKANKMSLRGNEKFKLYPKAHGAGDQNPECFDERTGDPLVTERCGILDTSVNGGAPVQSALKLTAALTNEEKLEVRAGI